MVLVQLNHNNDKYLSLEHLNHNKEQINHVFQQLNHNNDYIMSKKRNLVLKGAGRGATAG